MASSKNEPNIRLEYKYENHDLQYEGSYGNDKMDRMEVDEPVVQLPSESALKINDYVKKVRSLHLDNPMIKKDVIGKVPFLKEVLTSPGAVTKAVRVIDCHLWEKDLDGIQCVPKNEELSLSKSSAHGRKLTFCYKSNPAAGADIITNDELKQINSLLGGKPHRDWLISVLWLLLELAMNRFGRQG